MVVSGCITVKYHDHLTVFSSLEPKAHQVSIYLCSGVRSTSSNILNLLPNHFANQSQILYGNSMGRGNKSLFMESGSHELDGSHAHIW